MRRLLVAATLGLGLLSAGGLAAGAAAGPLGDGADAHAASAGRPLTPAHYQRGFQHHGHHRPHFAPPPRHHWYRVAPPSWHRNGHARDHRLEGRYRHGWQQHGWRH
jgi:hypothetical protein